jgi:Fe-S-cluster containining protein
MSKGCLCDQCSALCCRYFVLEIDKPETRRQFDDVRWYLIHENTFAFIEKKKWYLGVYSRCKHLQPDNRCGIYHTRPQICREYSTDNCDYHGGEYDWQVLFSSAEQLEQYANEWDEERKAKNRRAKEREARADKGGEKTDAKPKLKPKKKRRRPNLMPMLMAAAGGPNLLGPNVDLAAGLKNGSGAGGNGKAVSLPVLRR